MTYAGRLTKHGHKALCDFIQIAVFSLFCLLANSATAQSTPQGIAVRSGSGDGEYGRLHDLLVVSLTGQTSIYGTRWSAGGTLRLRALDTVGLSLGLNYLDQNASSLRFGIDVRPLFLIRFFSGHEMGDSRLDLFIDSLGFDIGTVTRLDVEPTFGFWLTFGVDIPIDELGRVFLRVEGGWEYFAPSLFSYPALGGPWAASGTLGLGVRFPGFISLQSGD